MERLPTLIDIPESSREPMPVELTKAYMLGSLAEIKETKLVPANELEAELEHLWGAGLTQSFFLQVFVKRLLFAGDNLLYSPWVVSFLVLLCKNVAMAVMYAYTLVRETRDAGPVTMSRLSELFPFGFPKEEAIHEYWDNQKADPPIPTMFGWDGDNKLDAPEVWKEVENENR